MEHYKEECIFHFCVLNNYLSKYFCCFPTEVINLINYHYITIYGVINKLPFVCDKPGNYYATQNLDYYKDGTVIKIISSNIILDLQHHTITNYGVGYIIHVNDVKLCEIKNGILISNWTIIYVENKSEVVVSNMSLSSKSHIMEEIGETGPRGDIGTCSYDIKKLNNKDLINVQHNIIYQKMRNMVKIKRDIQIDEH